MIRFPLRAPRTAPLVDAVFVAAVLVAAGLVAAQAHAGAPQEASAIEDVSLEDLLTTDTTVAAAKGAVVRASPGVVTVVTRDEIRRLGARTLEDLLPFIPGFDLGVDVTGVVGIAFRGVWGHEGKVLLMVDGVEMNETLYQTNPLGGHYPLDDAMRVEILRGPGSARYGGTAELAVINIITRTGTQKSALAGAVDYAQATTPFANGAASASVGGTIDALGGLDVSLNAHVGSEQRSERSYRDVYGDTWDMRGTSALDQTFVNAAVATPWLKARLIVDDYGVSSLDGYDTVLQRGGRMGFPAAYLDVEAPLAPAPSVTLTPHLVLQRQLPWWSFREDTPEQAPARVVADRGRAGVDVAWQPIPTLSLSGGAVLVVDATREVAQGSQPAPLDLIDTRFAGPDTTNYENGALYGEAQVETPLFTLTAGARGEVHSSYGASLVPRVALTRVFERGHLKLLVSGAFRAPSIVNIQSNPDIKPERTRVLELEAGLRIIDDMYVTLNAFDIEVRDPIVYFYDSESDVEGYANFPHTGSRGLEAELRYATTIADLDATWSFATPAGENAVAAYAVPGDPNRLLGMPLQKLVVRATFQLAPNVHFTPSAVLRSERAAVTSVADDGASRVTELPPSALLNAFIDADLFTNVNVGLGVRNILGEDFRLAEPYDSQHAPLPSGDRMWVVRIEARTPF